MPTWRPRCLSVSLPCLGANLAQGGEASHQPHCNCGRLWACVQPHACSYHVCWHSPPYIDTSARWTAQLVPLGAHMSTYDCKIQGSARVFKLHSRSAQNCDMRHMSQDRRVCTGSGQNTRSAQSRV